MQKVLPDKENNDLIGIRPLLMTIVKEIQWLKADYPLYLFVVSMEEKVSTFAERIN